MKMRATLFIAFRYLLGRANEGGRYLRGAAAGIALSLIPIVVTLMVADGMIRGISDRFIELGTGHLQIYDFDSSGHSKASDLEKLQSIEGFRGYWAERQGLGIAIGPEGRSGASVRAVEEGFLEDRGTKSFLTVHKGELRLKNGNDAVLGQELANILGVDVGATVRLMTSKISPDGRTIPRVSSFTVQAVVSSGYRDLDALWFFIPMDVGASLLAADSSRSFYTVKIESPYTAVETAASQMQGLLGMDYSVYTWKELQRSQYQSFESTRQMLLFIMALIVIIAAVNVSSATSMLVVERNRDIAILKSCGADANDTTVIFLFASLLTGFIGALAGLSAGLLIGISINEIILGIEYILGFFSHLFNGNAVRILNPEYYLEHIPRIIDWKSIMIIGFGTMLCSMLAALVPALRAGKMIPVQILQKH